MKKGWKIALAIIILTLVLCLLSFLFIRSIPQPPHLEIEIARQHIAEARKNNAHIYAKQLFEDALSDFDSAMAAWKRENERFIILREYEKTITWANKSGELAKKALLQSNAQAATLATELVKKINDLDSLVKEYNTVFTRIPLSAEIRTKISKGKLLLSEAQVAYKKMLYLPAYDKIEQARKMIESSNKNAHDFIRDYFQDFNLWKQWQTETIAESRQKSITVVVVDKFAAKCFVYKNGSLVHEFDAELGKNWIGDKQHRGDFATPEGKYNIVAKKEGRQTKYYKALLINYPNDDDKERFRRNVSNGALPKSSHIGGLIEIHGDGGKGADWTEGCVALTNSDMDKIYKVVKVGTPVTIIGSAASLNTIFRK